MDLKLGQLTLQMMAGKQAVRQTVLSISLKEAAMSSSAPNPEDISILIVGSKN
jgi:hypothetical protein